MGGEYSTYAGEQKCVQDFGRETKTEGISGRPRSVPENNFEMDFREMGSKLHSVGSVRLNWWAFWKCRKRCNSKCEDCARLQFYLTKNLTGKWCFIVQTPASRKDLNFFLTL